MIASAAGQFPLVEALFEVRFAPAQAQGIGLDAQKKLTKAFSERYPECQRVLEPHIGVQVQQQGSQLETRVLPPGHRLVLRAPRGERLIQLSSQALTLNMLRPYPGKSAFIEFAHREWETARGTLDLRLGPQITMRFVNRIDRSKSVLSPNIWLAEGPFISGGAIHATGGFLSRVQLQSDDETLTTSVTVGTLSPQDDDGHALALLLDIEVTCQTAMMLPTRSLEAQMSIMYAAAREAFFSSTSSEAQALWSPRPA